MIILISINGNVVVLTIFNILSFQEDCQELYCSPGKNSTGVDCQPLFSAVGTVYRLDFTLKPVNKKLFRMNLTSLVLALSDFVKLVEKKLGNIERGRILIIKMTHIINATTQEDDAEFRIEEVVTVFTIESKEVRDVIKFESSMMSLYNDTWDVSIGDDIAQFISIEDGQGRSLVTDESMVTLDEPELSPIHSYSFVVVLQGGWWKRPQYNVTKLMHCRQVRLNVSQYDLNNDTQEITIKASCVKVHHWDYTTLGEGTVQVCLDDYIHDMCNNDKHDEITWNPQSILSATLIVASMVCLFLTLMTFAVSSKMRSLPGKNTMGMCATLFLAQGLLQFGGFQTKYVILCKVLGVLSHYFLLSTFTWMTICSFHMYRVFCRLTTRDSDEEEKRLYTYYILLSNAIPTVVVATTLIANSRANSDGFIGYGKGICYLSGGLNVGLAAFAPVVISVLLNCFFFAKTAHAIYRTRKLTRNVNNEKQHVYVYVKLSTLTGLTWVTGIVAVIVQNVVLEYISIIFNASQGIFIFVAYVCTQRTIAMYKKKWQNVTRKPGDEYVSSTASVGKTQESTI